MAAPARKYNPGFLTDDELMASFCVRTTEFELPTLGNQIFVEALPEDIPLVRRRQVRTGELPDELGEILAADGSQQCVGEIVEVRARVVEVERPDPLVGKQAAVQPSKQAGLAGPVVAEDHEDLRSARAGRFRRKPLNRSARGRGGEIAIPTGGPDAAGSNGLKARPSLDSMSGMMASCAGASAMMEPDVGDVGIARRARKDLPRTVCLGRRGREASRSYSRSGVGASRSSPPAETTGRFDNRT